MRYLLHDVFTNSVGEYPENMAIIEEDGKKITYKELNNLANQFANCFKFYKKNEFHNSSPFIGILSSVHINSIAAVLGILKIGGCYVPLDEHSPTDRLMHILDNTKLDILVIDPLWLQNHQELFNHPCIKKVLILCDETINFVYEKLIHWQELTSFSTDEPEILNQVSDDLAYVLHSSGSTGIPKGIMLTHRNARTFVDWMHKEFALTSNDIVMSRAPFKFDLSVFDIFNTFKAGGRLVCFNWNRKRTEEVRHRDYVALMERERATILYTTPSTFITLINRGNLESANLSLSRIMYAGEPFPVPQLRKLKEMLPKTRIANIYGPTETNIITYYWVDEIPDNSSSIPLGYVVEDTEIIVVSEDYKRICEPNEIGELWCRGGTVTLGYLGMPEKTKECMVESPFHPYPCKYWRTGDFGYRDEEGLLHYRGRRDHMVKVKGYRIEIGEVETSLAEFKDIDEFAVVAIPHSDYGNQLICFFSRLPNTTFKISEILSFLKTKIPAYMIPTKINELNLLPKTSSGKVDRVYLVNLAQKEVSNVA